ncbi:unnamed protein product [Haemonchus placei]|uniref:Secreted protein n=1 Tax=Haemonchus placei TaxID=6290 RepID=A0A0N4VT46_HAEPC|nr:unnamed protein product [Haemonchus placei]
MAQSARMITLVQVSTLGIAERTLARALGSLPNCSLESALQDLLAVGLKFSSLYESLMSSITLLRFQNAGKK